MLIILTLENHKVPSNEKGTNGEEKLSFQNLIKKKSFIKLCFFSPIETFEELNKEKDNERLEYNYIYLFFDMENSNLISLKLFVSKISFKNQLDFMGVKLQQSNSNKFE